MIDNTSAHKASDYDPNIEKTLPFYRLFHNEILDLVQTVKPDVSSWLDTGCGTGFLAENGLKSFPGCTFYLADPSEGMLDIARGRLAAAGECRVVFLGQIPTARLAQKDLTKPQVLTAIQCHHYLSKAERKEAVKVCYDVLEENGLYITFENIRPLTGQGTRLGLDRWMRFMKEKGRSEESVAHHRARFDREYFPLTVTEHLELLNECGFSACELFWFSQMQAGFYAIK